MCNGASLPEIISMWGTISLSSAVLHVIDIMSNKVITVDVSNTAYDAVTKMLRRDVGSVVVKKDGKVVGIITKGDVLRKAVKPGLDPKKVNAENVMSKPVVTVDQNATLEEASQLMAKKNVSKLPVLKDGELVGIITSSDIIRAEPMQVGYLQELIKARYVPHELR